MEDDVQIITEKDPISKQFGPFLQGHHDAEAAQKAKRAKEAQQAYGRGRRIRVGSIKDKKLRSNLKALEEKYKDASLKAKDAEILLENDTGFLEPEGELEKTYKVRQGDLVKDAPSGVANKGFELKLNDLGPYLADYTRNGRNMLLAGRKGHVSTMDWQAGKLGCELQLRETVRDAKWLHNNQYFAVAQKKYVYIYDQAGVELHCLKKHIDVTSMQFLPYHFLLATLVRYDLSIANRCTLTASELLGLSQIYRYVHGPNGDRTTHKARLAYSICAKSVQRDSTCWASKRHSDTLVP